MPFKNGIVNFYQVVDETNSGLNFNALLDLAVAVPEPVDRHRPAGGFTLRLEQAFVGRNGPSIEMVKIRTEDLPSVIAADGSLADFAGDGIAEHTSFLLLGGTNIIAVLRSGHGPTNKAIVQYFECFAPPGVRLTTHEILNLDAIGRLGRMDHVRSISFTVARPQNLVDLHADSPQVEDALKFLRSLGGESLKVELGMGHRRKGGLVGATAKAFASALLRELGLENVERLRLNGSDEDGEPTPVDLITDRLLVNVRMDVPNGATRNDKIRLRHQAIEAAVDHHAEFLRRL